MNGIMIVDKPTGYTSRDIVNIVSKTLKTKKVGHTGTLDPIASGVLVLVFGRYTKLVELLTSLDKTYIAEMKLGILTDTLDITGNVIEEKPFSVTEEKIKETLKAFLGTYKMEVPIYSAIKVNGKKLYEYAREKKQVNLPVKEVEIKDLELLEFSEDTIKFKTHVSKGTYIRSLIRDIANKLNTVGTMTSLKRIEQGTFKLDQANTLEDIKNNNYKVYTLKEVLDIKEVPLTIEEFSKVKNGNPIKLDITEDIVLLTYEKNEIAIYKKTQDIYKSYVMLEINNRTC